MRIQYLDVIGNPLHGDAFRDAVVILLVVAAFAVAFAVGWVLERRKKKGPRDPGAHKPPEDGPSAPQG